MSFVSIFTWLVLSVGATMPADKVSVPDYVDSQLNQLPQARVGLSVIDVESQQVLLQEEANALLNPA